MIAKSRLVALLVALTGCTVGPSAEQQRQLDQMEQIAAEKEQLMSEVVANARLMSEISSALAAVNFRPEVFEAVSLESPVEASHDSLVAMVANVTARVNDSEARLAESRRRIRSLTAESDSMRVELEETISNFESVIANQKATILALNEQVDRLVQEAVRLAEEKAALADSLAEAAVLANRAYYIIGTKDELLERGIVVEEGGSRFLFIFGKRGKTLRPAVDLDESDFVLIDRQAVTEISLPDPEREYKIASRQNLDFLETPPDDHGEIRGSLRIDSPVEFWKPSKFLIIVES
jgi:hypothetical protein